MALEGIAGNATAIVVLDQGEFKLVAQAAARLGKIQLAIRAAHKIKDPASRAAALAAIAIGCGRSGAIAALVVYNIYSHFTRVLLAQHRG